MAGWIKLSRDINKHWIWQSDRRLKWWIDILITVNHADSKVLIKGTLVDCKRGQSVMSLETWAKRWNVTKKTVRDFFELLQKDSMIVSESVKITTRITVCNYETYQSEVNGSETQGKRKVNAKETQGTPKQECKEGIKKDEEGRENPLPDEPADFIAQIVDLFVRIHGNYEIVTKGKERSAAGKILAQYKKKYPNATSEETISGLSEYFRSCVNISDDWLRNNMSLSIIVDKFNVINNILKNGNNKRNCGATREQIANLIASTEAIDRQP